MAIMNRTDRREFEKLLTHIESCPSVPPQSLVSQLVLKRLNQKLNQYGTTTSNRSRATATDTASRKYKKQKTKTKAHHHPFQSILTIIRIILIDTPLTLLFISILTTHGMSAYYKHYVTPMIKAAHWYDNNRLSQEFTYYDRPCDTSDISITTDSLDEVTFNERTHSPTDVADLVLEHGVGLFENVLLDDEVADNLRAYIRKRNYELSDDEIIPLDTPDKRHSFGIDANEDPSVAIALNQIGTHKLLKESLETILGPDPAVAEITAITVEAGAHAQGWHPDVKPQGNSLKYGQTFTHSYSVFIPLQNVTKRMGATEICPGTQYCASEELEDVCIEGGFQATESNDIQNAWKKGDGLIMNQKMWHRGALYSRSSRRDENPDRVVFILTFISRPNFGVDHRQLSHGTYFHIHPYMYGHTFRDLKNAQISMSWPFSMMRSIGIWKPPHANWGYDFVTSTSLRISNAENGYEYEDLVQFVRNHELASMIPSFLHGEVNETGGWKLYIQDTISRIRLFFVVVYAVLLVAYLLMILVLDFVEGGKNRRTKSAITRLVIINVTILLFAQMAVNTVKETQFCKSVDNKTIYARPFLPKPLSQRKKKPSGIGTREVTTYRPTTVPTKMDVLVGIRYDSKHIGYYKNFLKFHPGNKELRHQVDNIYGDLYHAYKGLPKVFQDEVLNTIESNVDRFLLQNDYGEWTLMTKEEKRDKILKDLMYSASGTGLLSALDKEISILSSSARFVTTIRSSTVMKQETLNSMMYWRDDVLGEILGIYSSKTKMTVSSTTIKANTVRFDQASLFKLPPNPVKSMYLSQRPQRKKLIGSDVKHHNYKIGDHILFNYHGTGIWLNGYIINIEFGDYGYVERRFNDGLTERSGIYLENAKPYVPLIEGQEIAVIRRKCPRCQNSYHYGIIQNIYPNFDYDVLYDDGNADFRIGAGYIGRVLQN